MNDSAVQDVAIETTAADYLAAAGGNPDRALWLAVADLLKSHGEAALVAIALDQWTSRGYVRGRATERLGLSSGPVEG